jgi:hypothetical protein
MNTFAKNYINLLANWMFNLQFDFHDDRHNSRDTVTCQIAKIDVVHEYSPCWRDYIAT